MIKKKLNLGSGKEEREGGPESPILSMEEWVYVDANPDFKDALHYDVCNLPADWSNTFEEIRASHVIEHLREAEVHVFLEECRRVLVTGGHINIYCPDFRKIASAFANGKMSVEDYTILTFGGTDTFLNMHKTAFDRARLENVVTQHGFRIIGREPRPNIVRNFWTETALYIHGYMYDLGVQAIKL